MGFFKIGLSVACMLLMAVLSNARNQPIPNSSSAVSVETHCPVEGLESRLTNIEEQLNRMLRIVSTLNNPSIKENCTVDLASYGFDDATKFGYIRTNGGSSESTYEPEQVARYRGVTIVELDPTTCISRERQRFDTHNSTHDITRLLETLGTATSGTIMVGVTADSAEDFTLKFQNSAGLFFNSYNMNIRGLRRRDKFVFVMQKSYPTKTVFQRKPHHEESLRMKVALRGSSVYDVTFHQV